MAEKMKVLKYKGLDPKKPVHCTRCMAPRETLEMVTTVHPRKDALVWWYVCPKCKRALRGD